MKDEIMELQWPRSSERMIFLGHEPEGKNAAETQAKNSMQNQNGFAQAPRAAALRTIGRLRNDQTRQLIELLCRGRVQDVAGVANLWNVSESGR